MLTKLKDQSQRAATSSLKVQQEIQERKTYVLSLLNIYAIHLYMIRFDLEQNCNKRWLKKRKSRKIKLIRKYDDFLCNLFKITIQTIVIYRVGCMVGYNTIALNFRGNVFRQPLVYKIESVQNMQRNGLPLNFALLLKDGNLNFSFVFQNSDRLAGSHWTVSVGLISLHLTWPTRMKMQSITFQRM